MLDGADGIKILLFALSYRIVSQFRAEKGELPEAGDMKQAEAVFGLAKACNGNEEDGGFKADGLDDSKVRVRVL